MEQREIWAIPLSIFTDEILPFSYIKILSDKKYESVKIGTKLESCKFRHLLNPNYLLKLELIKTRKNWIIKQVLEYKQACLPKTYHDFLKQTELIKLLQANITEDQEVVILSFILSQFASIARYNQAEFEQELQKRLGF